MSDNEKKILETFKETIPIMTEKQKDFLVGYMTATNDIYVQGRLKREEQKDTA